MFLVFILHGQYYVVLIKYSCVCVCVCCLLYTSYNARLTIISFKVTYYYFKVKIRLFLAPRLPVLSRVTHGYAHALGGGRSLLKHFTSIDKSFDLLPW